MTRMLVTWICRSLLLGLATGSTAAVATAEDTMLVTYGSGAETDEGDDDARQVVFIRVPPSTGGELHVRLFDADCGGELDDAADDFDTVTRFRLLSGEFDGEVLAEAEYGEDPLLDRRWATFATFTAADGDAAVFRLEVEGVVGDDANLFDVAVSRDPKRNDSPPGLELSARKLTLRLAHADTRAEMQFLVPTDAAEIELHGFDLAGARLALDTASRDGLPVASSGQGEWTSTTVSLNEDERGRRAALVFLGGGEVPNDASFQVTHGDEILPIRLPVPVRPANRRPTPRPTTLALADCRTVVFDAAASSDADDDNLEYFWDFGDGSRGRGKRTGHVYEAPGTYHAELRVVDDSGQVTAGVVQRVPVSVNVPPEAMAGADLVAAPGESLSFDGTGSTDRDGEIVRYVWDLDDGTRVRGEAVSHAYSTSGTYHVVLRVEDDADSPCNFGADELTVWVNAAPAVELGGDRIGSPRETFVFEPARLVDSDGEIVRWAWELGDGNVGEGPGVDHAYDEPGTYRVTLTVTDDAGVSNSSATDQLAVRVNDRPVAAAGADQRAASRETVVFDGGGSLDRDGTLVTHRWEFGDGGVAEGERVTHAYAVPGSYEVRLTVRDDSTTSSDTDDDTLRVVVNHPPRAVAGDDQLVTASEVRFDAAASHDPDGTLIAYRWEFGDAASSDAAAPVHVYRGPGTYDVTLTVRDDSGTSSHETSDVLRVTVNAVPIADAGSDRVAVPGETLAFDAGGSVDPDGTIAEARWDFGDGTVAEGTAASHAWEVPGTYAVELAVGDDTGHPGAVAWDQATVRVNRPPVAIAGTDVVAAPGDAIVLDGGGSWDGDGVITAYRWELSDGRGAEGAVVRDLRFDQPGTYRATLTVRDDSGARNALADDEVVLHINHPPEARAGEDVFGCASTVWFDGSGSVDPDGDPLIYTWDFGDGSPVATGPRPSHTWTRGGKYPVVLTVDDGHGFGNSRQSASLTVTINEPPVADAGEDRVVCAGVPVLLSGSGSYDPEEGLLRYLWDFDGDTTDDGNRVEGINPTTTFRRGGTFPVTLTVRDDSGLACNTATDTAVLRVAASPVAEAGTDRAACLRSPVTFDGSASQDFVDGVVDSFFWDFGDGSVGGGTTAVHAYEKPGEYRVILTITGNEVGECENSDSAELTVTVLEGPVARIDGPEAVAQGTAADFDAGASSDSAEAIAAWAWDFGDGSTAEGERVSHTWNEPGTYPVRLTLTSEAADCRTATTETRVVVNAPPRAVAGGDRAAGVHELLTFSAAASEDPDGSLVAWEWDFGDGTRASGVEVRHRYTESGRFPVTLTVRDEAGLPNSSVRDTVEVRIDAAPEPVIDASSGACEGEDVAFSAAGSRDADGEIVLLRWDFGDGATAEGSEVRHTFTRPGSYAVRLEADDGLGTSNSRAAVSRTFTVNRPPVPRPGPGRRICPGDEVAFDAGASSDPDGEIRAHRWDFGDGASADGVRASHVYTASGRYTVELEVDDGSGTSCGVASAGAAVDVNASPAARFTAPEGEIFAGGAHDAVVFDATSSSDPDGDPLTYSWDFGDDRGARGRRVRHSYLEPGTYTVRLRLDDGSGLACGAATSELGIEVRSR